MKKDRILVIDDELVICTLLSDVLKDRGYDVEYCQSPTEGLKLIAGGKFDVVIMDLKMPEIEGTELLREIKLKEDPDAVVIVITGHGTLESAQHALRLGAYDYITKPFKPDRIYFTVRRAVASRKLVEKNKKLLSQLQDERNKLEQRIKAGVKEAEFIYYIAREISSSLELEEVLPNIIDSIVEKLNVTRCSLLLFNEDGQILSIKYARGLNKEVIRQTLLKKGEKISGWVAEQSELIFSEDVNSDPRFSRRKQEKYYSRSLISIPLIVRNECIGVININDKKTEHNFTDSDLQLLKQVASEISIGIVNAKLYKNLQDTYQHTVKALLSVIDTKDRYTKTHSEQVIKYAVAMAQEIGLPLKEIETIKEAGRLHDLGNLGVHDYILTKAEKLTPKEWEEVKLHALTGVKILKPLNIKKGVTRLIEQHHERFDGKGYPNGLKGEEVELGARIMAVADAYDAMVSSRPYRKALSKPEAINELNKNSGSQFDPLAVKALLRVLEKED
ncbi:HD domain-containing phosphohydrolase [Candidatus Omnitrophota bacterium]